MTEFTVKCGLCDEPVTIDSESDEGKLYLNKGGEVRHQRCPRDIAASEARAANHRRFEARVQIVEILDTEQGAPQANLTELASFIVHADGSSLNSVIRLLAMRLGERWLEVENHATLIDVPDMRELT